MDASIDACQHIGCAIHLYTMQCINKSELDYFSGRSLSPHIRSVFTPRGIRHYAAPFSDNPN